jgi:dUTP pyrophosphatase
MGTIKFKKLSQKALIPSYAHVGDAGFDLYAIESTSLKKGEIKLIPLGMASEFSKKYFVSFRDKSGLALNYGIHVLGGVIDSTYRGEWKVILVNLGKTVYKINAGEKVAQGIFQPIAIAKMKIKNQLEKTKRGKGGFGSTGK